MITHTVYKSLKDIPPKLHMKARTLGHLREDGELRDVMSGKYPMRFCIILFWYDKPIGLAAYYDGWWNDRTASFWIQTRHRNMGYGKELVRRFKQEYKNMKFRGRPWLWETMPELWERV